MTKVKDVPGCQGCPMLRVDCEYEKEGKKIHHIGAEMNFVPPQVGPSLRLVVAEAPGETENETMVPLSGSAGHFFDSLARKAGIDRGQLTVINCINCRPPNNKFPGSSESRFYITEDDADKARSQCFNNHVAPILEGRPWERIDALGGKALEQLTGEKGGIQKWRGSPLHLIGEQGKRRVIPTLHPSYIMQYGQAYIPVVISDLKKGTNVPPEHYNLKPTVEEVAAFRATRFCFDIETNMFTGQITVVGISDRPFHVTVVPFRGPYIAELKRIFANATEVIGHNIISFDLPVLKMAGVEVTQACQVWDTILMQHLLQPDLPHDLEFVSSVFTQKPAWKHLANEDKELYCARDVDATMMIWQQLLPVLKQQRLLDLYLYTQVPLARICHLIEKTGIHTSGKAATEARQKLLAEIVQWELKLPKELQPYDKSIRVRKLAPAGTIGKSGKPVKYTHVPGTERIVPWNSPDEVKRYLYHTLGLPEQIHSKTKKVTTDKIALEKLYHRTKNESLLALRKLRSLDELATSFVKGMKDEDGKEIAIKDGKINPRLSPYGTSQGRLSSAHPNMQNQPPAARFIYVPSDPTWCLVEADFSQGENRLTAWYANDQERLQRLSIPGFSEHKLNANIFFGVPYKVDLLAGKVLVDEVIKDNSPDAPYGKAKKLTHGINYGEGARKISMNTDIPEKEVKELLFKWKQANAPTVRWMEGVSKQAEREGVLTNRFGRKRWFFTNRLYGESLSMLPQSSLADICFRAMIGLMYDRINWPIELALKASPILAPLPYPARLLLQVHDSLLVECPIDLVPQVVRCLKAVMEQPWTQLGGFGLPAEFSVGEPGASWGELKSYKIE